jgi:hypothetical protein
VRGDDVVTLAHVVGGQQRFDVGDGHAQVPESLDDVGSINLVGVIEPVTALGVNVRGLEQPKVVVMPKCLPAQTGHHREVTD